MIKYQFIMSHRGILPLPRTLRSFAKEHNGGFIASTNHYTGSNFESFLDNFYPLFDPIEHTGKRVSCEFENWEGCDNFTEGLARKGVVIFEEVEKREVAA